MTTRVSTLDELVQAHDKVWGDLEDARHRASRARTMLADVDRREVDAELGETDSADLATERAQCTAQLAAAEADIARLEHVLTGLRPRLADAQRKAAEAGHEQHVRETAAAEQKLLRTAAAFGEALDILVALGEELRAARAAAQAKLVAESESAMQLGLDDVTELADEAWTVPDGWDVLKQLRNPLLGGSALPESLAVLADGPRRPNASQLSATAAREAADEQKRRERIRSLADSLQTTAWADERERILASIPEDLRDAVLAKAGELAKLRIRLMPPEQTADDLLDSRPIAAPEPGESASVTELRDRSANPRAAA
jgi:hypothetical protein